jgi:hypothetical protein
MSDQQSSVARHSNVANDTIAEFLNIYRGDRRDLDSVNGTLRANLKRAGEQGVNKKALRRAVTALKRDPEEVVRDLADEIHYINLLRQPIHADDLFAGWSVEVSPNVTRANDLWDAETLGLEAGRGGRDRAECPYQPGSELAAAWLKWWKRGETAKATEAGPTGEGPDATRARPRQMRIPGTEAKSRGGNGKSPPKRRGKAKPAAAKRRGRPPKLAAAQEPATTLN